MGVGAVEEFGRLFDNQLLSKPNQGYLYALATATKHFRWSAAHRLDIVRHLVRTHDPLIRILLLHAEFEENGFRNIKVINFLLAIETSAINPKSSFESFESFESLKIAGSFGSSHSVHPDRLFVANQSLDFSLGLTEMRIPGKIRRFEHVYRTGRTDVLELYLRKRSRTSRELMIGNKRTFLSDPRLLTGLPADQIAVCIAKNHGELAMKFRVEDKVHLRRLLNEGFYALKKRKDGEYIRNTNIFFKVNQATLDDQIATEICKRAGGVILSQFNRYKSFRTLSVSKLDDVERLRYCILIYNSNLINELRSLRDQTRLYVKQELFLPRTFGIFAAIGNLELLQTVESICYDVTQKRDKLIKEYDGPEERCSLGHCKTPLVCAVLYSGNNTLMVTHIIKQIKWNRKKETKFIKNLKNHDDYHKVKHMKASEIQKLIKREIRATSGFSKLYRPY